MKLNWHLLQIYFRSNDIWLKVSLIFYEAILTWLKFRLFFSQNNQERYDKTRSSIAYFRNLLFEMTQKNATYIAVFDSVREAYLALSSQREARNVKYHADAVTDAGGHTLHATHTGPVRGSSWTEYKSRVFRGAPCDFSLSPT